MYYYLSLGSNIEPEKNAFNMISALAGQFGSLVSYPFAYTEPENIKTKRAFLNSVAIISSPLPSKRVKECLNQIEIHLGRDRSDPDRSLKDRTADIDILGETHEIDYEFFQSFSEPYVSTFESSESTIADLTPFGLPPTQGPTTIDLDATSGQIRVIDSVLDRQKDRFKASL